MSIKAKLAAAVQRANEDPKKGKYMKTITPNPQPQKPKQPTTSDTVYNKNLKGKLTEIKKTDRTPMSPMTTLRPTSVSVSPEKRTPAPVQRQVTTNNSKRRG